VRAVADSAMAPTGSAQPVPILPALSKADSADAPTNSLRPTRIPAMVRSRAFPRNPWSLRRGRLSREKRAHVRLVLVVEVAEERGPADRGPLQPRKALRVFERIFGQFLDRRHELFEYATRLSDGQRHGLITVARMEPRIDLVVLMQIGGPLWLRFRLTI